MDNTIRIVRFDWLTTKKSYIFLIVWFFTFGIYLSVSIGDVSLTPFNTMLWSTFLAGFPFSINKKQGLDQLLATFPINRKAVVRGRFIYALLSGCLGISLSEIIVCITSSVFGLNFEMKNVLLSLCSGLILFFLIVSIQLLLYFTYPHAIAIQMAPLFLFLTLTILYQVFYFNGALSIFIHNLAVSVWKFSIGTVFITAALSLSMFAASYLAVCKLSLRRDL